MGATSEVASDDSPSAASGQPAEPNNNRLSSPVKHCQADVAPGAGDETGKILAGLNSASESAEMSRQQQGPAGQQAEQEEAREASKKAKKKKFKAKQSASKSNDTKKAKTTTTKKSKTKRGESSADRDGNQQQQSQQQQALNSSSSSSKPRLLVEELKLFQNNHLLNQQDPLQRLHIQLSELIKDDDGDAQPRLRHQSAFQQNQLINGTDNSLSQQRMHQQGSDSLTVPSQDSLLATYVSGENISTVKKGVLWHRQNYDKFHQRLFSRWKKRYFILTTDYLVCFKRSPSKVGRSEMGKFLYKTSLSDVAQIEWLKPGKSDKGAIVLHISEQFKLFLWSKKNLDDWMFVLKESVERNKIRRSCLVRDSFRKSIQNGAQKAVASTTTATAAPNTSGDELYENAAVVRDSSEHQPITNGLIPLSNDSKNLSHDQRTKSEAAKQVANNSSHPSSIESEEDSNNKVSRTKFATTKQESAESENERRSHLEDHEANVKSSASSGSSGCGRPGLVGREHGKALDHRDSQPTVAAATVASISVREGDVQVDKARPSGRGRKPIMINDTPSSKANSCTSDAQEASSSPRALLHRGASSRASQVSSNHRLETNQTATSTAFSHSSDRANRELKDSLLDGNSRSKSEKETNLVKVDLRKSGSSNVEGDEDNNDETITDNSQHASNKTTCNSNESSICSKASSASSKAIQEPTKKGARDSGKAFSRPDKREETIGSEQQITPADLPVPRPTTNLIRRDDSWQSLVSLTRVGKVTPTGMQVAQRSLYAQHIMPGGGSANNYSQNRQHTINIESTVTPLRGPLLRQHSIQPKLRALPGPIGQQQAASFDVAPKSLKMQTNQLPATAVSNFLQHQQPFVGGASYQQKLLQLQLLHNSNNVDYIRHNGESDYQIYGPESVATNHYGYSSMRSNLKSAASEFSFIRPSSSSHIQSTLPHHPNNDSSIQQSYKAFDSQDTRQQQARLSGLILKQSDNNNNEIGVSQVGSQPSPPKQYLVNPMTGERLINEQQLVDAAMVPPMRDLPLKPNKKRNLNIDTQNNSLHQPKSSSLTSSIVCFFRRAFSRRAKKGSKRRSKLAESCSSSLGAFEDKFPSVPIVPSAFSTGSKSVDGRKNLQAELSAQPQQSQRMVDMIEAFTNKTLLQQQQLNGSNLGQGEKMRNQFSGAFSGLDDSSSGGVPEIVGNQQQQAGAAFSNNLRARLNQIGGSPLHKSNSISATMGLSLVSNQNCITGKGITRGPFLYDNEIGNNVASGGANVGASPMLKRSAKVMSANLTPLMSRRDTPKDSENHQPQFYPSPRNSRAEQLPRPSSIYGQPSMIASASPVIIREERNNNFGIHRNSLNNGNFKDRANLLNAATSASGGHNQFADLRRHNQHHQLMKISFLGTTREVAEELSSPTADSGTTLYDHELAAQNQTPARFRSQNMSDGERLGSYMVMERDISGYNMITSSPSSGKLPQHRQAVVNPILQSPTMDTIYDNHPHMLNRTTEPHSFEADYSHYDNHNQLLLERQQQLQQQSPSMRLMGTRPSNSMSQFMPTSDEIQDGDYSRRLVNSGNFPSSRASRGSHRLLDYEMALTNKKPSAIVAPSTPSYGGLNSYKNDHHQQNSPCLSSPSLGQLVQRSVSGHQQQQQQQQQPRSPLMARRRDQAQNHHYQQSPLVSQQTRVLSKGDGIQATIIGDAAGAGRANGNVQPVVNIAGAPGINLEPSLAASLLRGTNINAYESSTFDRLGGTNGMGNINDNTFLVSTRLSKSMAYRQTSGNAADNIDSGSASGQKDGACLGSAAAAATSFHRLSKDADDLSSTSGGSRSINSSLGRASLNTRASNNLVSRNSSQEEDQLEASSGSQDSRGSKSTRHAYRHRQDELNTKRVSKKSSRQKNRGSSVDPSDEINGSTAGSLEKLDERNWITSKLVEQ